MTSVRRSPRLLIVALASLLVVPSAVASAALAPPSKQVLRVGIGTLPSSLDPGEATYEEDLIVQNVLFPSLYRSPGGSGGTLVPYLAAGQPVVANGGLRYTVKLRAAKWSDGKPVTAADVKLGYTRAKDSYYGSFFTPVRSVTAIGPRTVRFELTQPVPWFGELLASNVVAPVPSHVIKRVGKRWTHLTNLVTAGPFKVASGRGRSELVLTPNTHWWSARTVRLREVQLLAVAAASVSPTFRAARLDVTLRGGSIHPSALSSWIEDPRFTTVASGQAQYLHLNTRASALQNPAVRRGIALAIDRAAITAKTGKRLDEPLETIIPDGTRGFSTVAGGTHLLDGSGVANRTQATAELTAGGWVRSTKLDLYYPSGSSYGGAIATQIQADLFAVGVEVALHPTSAKEFGRKGIGISPVRDDVELVLQGWLPDYSDAQSFHQLFTCANVDGGLNTSNFCSPEFDAAYGAAVTFGSFATRAAAHRAAEDLLTGPTGLMPAVPLYVPIGPILVQPWVKGFAQHPSGRVDFERVSIHAH